MGLGIALGQTAGFCLNPCSCGFQPGACSHCFLMPLDSYTLAKAGAAGGDMPSLGHVCSGDAAN